MSSSNRNPQKPDEQFKPWISMRTGLAFITVLSLVEGVLTAIQWAPQAGLVPAIVRGLVSAVLIWVLFFGIIAFYRWLRR